MKQQFKVYAPKMINDNESWVGCTFGGKPPQCSQCRYQNVGSGFIPDRLEAASGLIFVIPKPSSSDVETLLLGHGGTMANIVRTMLARLNDEGIAFDKTMSETSRSPLPRWIGFSAAIRCLPPSVRRGEQFVRLFPEGVEGRAAIRGCATYDDTIVDKAGYLQPTGGLRSLGISSYMITLDPGNYHNQPAFKEIIDTDVFAAAKHYLETGKKTAILFGSNVFLPILPSLAGGAKVWRGSLIASPAGGFNRAHYGGLDTEAELKPLRNTVHKQTKDLTYTPPAAIKEKKEKKKSSGKKPKQLELF